VGATRDAALSLVRAHLDLARAEFEDILGEVKRLAIFVGIALGLLLLFGLLVPIGLVLFLGEWLFGSIGWGVLLGGDLLLACALALVFAAIGVPGRTLLSDLLTAAFLGVVVGIGLGASVTNQAWTRLGELIAPTLAADSRPLVVAVVAVGAVLGLVGLLLGARAGGIGGAIGGAIAGIVVGALVGALTAIAFSPQVGAAVGAVVGLTAWIVFMSLSTWRHGINGDDLKRRFWPGQTIDTTKETIEWVRERTPLGRRS
jgi:hypothetical protein